MPSGGARPGAGRPRKALGENLLEGNPGKRPIKVLKFQGEEQPKPDKPKSKKPEIPSYLDIVAKEGGDMLPAASEIYKTLSEWIAKAGCTDFVAPNLVEDFALLRRGYLETEYMNKRMGRIAGGKRSPYVGMAIDYLKASMSVFNTIWNAVARNCEEPLEGKGGFLEALANRGY